MTSLKWVDLGGLTVKPGKNRTNTTGEKTGRDLGSATQEFQAFSNISVEGKDSEMKILPNRDRQFVLEFAEIARVLKQWG